MLIRVLLSRTGSAMSLASGLVFGGLLTYGAARLSANSKDTLFAFGERIKMYTKSSAQEIPSFGGDVKLSVPGDLV